ncbi:MAG: GEVED domain-containing protein, partial [Nitrospira sp.]|nr:GEVED domain-containing protein [Nitrospira sp.]
MKTAAMWYLALGAVLSLAAQGVAAWDYGDAPAGYGLSTAYYTGPEKFGFTWTDDASNPVTPAWTGDEDDGLAAAGWNGVWVAGSSTNEISIYAYCGGFFEYVTMFVDFNDNGNFNDPGERIDYPGNPIPGTNGVITFTGISVPSVSYSLNATNGIGVRFSMTYAGVVPGPSGTWTYGEIEDY